MSNIFKKTIEELQKQAMTDDEILVSYSGGKDSLVVLDLCSKIFKKVICFFMYIVPGLEVCEKQLTFARDRYGVEVVQYPHWLLSRVLKNGIYCNNYYTLDNLPELKPNDIYAVVREDTGIDLIATGMKKKDGPWRNRNLHKETPNIIHPLIDWDKYQVLAYCKMNDIPLPDAASGGNVSGIDLTTRSLLWLYDNYPEDFRKLCKVFPYAEVQVWRREWYGKELRKLRDYRNKPSAAQKGAV